MLANGLANMPARPDPKGVKLVTTARVMSHEVHTYSSEIGQLMGSPVEDRGRMP